MKNYLFIYIGLRYLRAKQNSGFISFVSWFALIGMGLGVFSLVVVLSVMNGFDRELKDRILRVVPHGFITTQTPLNNWQALASTLSQERNVVASAPFIQGRGLVNYGSTIRPIDISGIAPAYEKNISVINDYMLVGKLDNLNDQPFGIILGRLLVNNLGLTIGDNLTLTLPQVSMTPAGIFARSKRFTLVGVFEVGALVDQNLALVSLRDAQKLFRYGKAVEGVHVRFDDIYQAPSHIPRMVNALGENYQGKDWSQTQGNLFQAVKMEKTVVGIMLGIIIAVAAFNIITSLTMMVVEKRSNIAVLRTLGMTRITVMLIFLVQGVSMGIVGIVFGGALGSFVAMNIPAISALFEKVSGVQLFDPLVYFVSYLPSQWEISDFISICSFAVLASVLASIYPAWKASKIEPAEALRYDS